MKAALGSLLVVAALLTWWLASPDMDRSAESRRAAETERAISEPDSTTDRTEAVDAELTRLEDAGVARVEGFVSGPDGPVWAARVRIHVAGKEAAFDEVGTDTDGRYAIEFAIDADGEDLELEFQPPAGSPLKPSTTRPFHLAPGFALRRDLAFAGTLVLSGDVVGIGQWRTEAVGLVAVEFAAWEELRNRTGNRYPAWSEIAPLVRGRARATPEFRFPQLDDGEYAILSAQRDYVVLTPEAVRPGDASVRVAVAHLTHPPGAYFDARNGREVNARVDVRDDDPTPYFVRSMTGEGEPEEPLRWVGLGSERSRTLRVTSDGYYERIIEQRWYDRYRVPGGNGLVPLDARKVTVQVTGPGASLFAREARLMTTRNAADGKLHLATEAAVVQRAGTRVTWAIPASGGTAYFFGEGLGLGQVNPFDLAALGGGDLSIDLAFELPALIEFEEPVSGQRILTVQSVTGPKLEWRPRDDVYRLTNLAATGGGLEIPRSWFLSSGRRPLAVPAGTWTFHWQTGLPGESRERHKRAVTVSPGETLTFRFDGD